MSDDFTGWPLLLAEVGEALGKDAAMRLLTELGGQKIHIPTKAKGSNLQRRVGVQIAEYLCDVYGGTQIPIPNFKARSAAEVRAYVLQNPQLAANHIAAELGLSSRRVEQIRAEARQDNGQADLFV